MRTRARQILVAGLCLMAVGLTGCMTPNVRHAKIGRVTAHAHLTKGVPSYYEIEIKQPVSTGSPRIALQLPNGKVLDRSAFTYENLKLVGFMGSDSRDYQPDRTYSHELSRYGVTFFFHNGALMLLRMSQTTGPSVGIGGERGKQFYNLPLSQEELQRLFGAPDEVSDEFRMM